MSRNGRSAVAFAAAGRRLRHAAWSLRRGAAPLATLLLPLAVAAAPPLPDQSPDRTLGVASCASSLCHGSIAEWQGSPVAQNEYVIWSRLDKHARAYQLLLEPASKKIAQKLELAEPAHEAKICLDCHAHNPTGPSAEAHVRADGVGCEACHGPAERWIASHTGPEVAHAANVAEGLYPGDDPLARARLCLSCHYGTADKYVTHRMMAAGHPRLSFELDTFTQLQPPHFRIDDDYRRRKGGFDGVHSWAIGQAVAVSTQIGILLDPVRGRDGVFPELTLFDCHACHRPLTEARWQPRQSFVRNIAPGLVRLNEASLLMLRLILRETDAALAERYVAAVWRLNRAVAGDGDVTARARQLKAIADEAIERLARSGLDDQRLRAMALSLIDDAGRSAYADYSAAEQAAMALGSIVNALHRQGRIDAATPLNRGLARLRATLRDDSAYRATDFDAAMQAMRPLLARAPARKKIP
jgi:hypothetical protein